MKNFVKSTVAVVLCFISVIFSVVGASAQDKIIITDYYQAFDVWQGEGDVSVVVKYHYDYIDSQLIFEKFDGLTYRGDKVDDECYEIADADNHVKITLKEEYIRTFNDGAYYFEAEFERIDIGLQLYVITEKVTVSDVIFEDEWNGSENACFTITGIDYPLGAEVLEYISLNGEKLAGDNYLVSFMGNNGIVTILKKYLISLPAGTHIFDIEFLSVSGIQLKIEIPDFYAGDTDFDGKLTAGDARKILRMSAGLETDTSEDILWIADIDDNGRITASDARSALRVSAKLENAKIKIYSEYESDADFPIYSSYEFMVVKSADAESIRNEYLECKMVDSIDIKYNKYNEAYLTFYVKSPVAENSKELLKLLLSDKRLDDSFNKIS